MSESTDLSTEIMTTILADLQDISAYMDNIGCWSNSRKHHLQLLETVLLCLQEHGFNINPLKCNGWSRKQTSSGAIG